MAWFVLGSAGLLEVCWSVGLKYTQGFTRPVPSILTVFAIVASMGLLAHAAKTLPLGSAYAIWVGIGVVGTVFASALLFGESLTPLRLFFVGLLLVAIVGLKLTSTPA